MGESNVRYFRLTHDFPPALNAGRMHSLYLCKTTPCPADVCTMPLLKNLHRSASNARGIMGEPKIATIFRLTHGAAPASNAGCQKITDSE